MTSCELKDFPSFPLIQDVLTLFLFCIFEPYFKHKNKFERFISIDYTNFWLNFHCLNIIF